jgi:hypothetical protein
MVAVLSQGIGHNSYSMQNQRFISRLLRGAIRLGHHFEPVGQLQHH